MFFFRACLVPVCVGNAALTGHEGTCTAARARAIRRVIQYASPHPRTHRACAFRVVRQCDATLVNLIKRESQACLAEGEGVGRRFYR